MSSRWFWYSRQEAKVVEVGGGGVEVGGAQGSFLKVDRLMFNNTVEYKMSLKYKSS